MSVNSTSLASGLTSPSTHSTKAFSLSRPPTTGTGTGSMAVSAASMCWQIARWQVSHQAWSTPQATQAMVRRPLRSPPFSRETLPGSISHPLLNALRAGSRGPITSTLHCSETGVNPGAELAYPPRVGYVSEHPSNITRLEVCEHLRQTDPPFPGCATGAGGPHAVAGSGRLVGAED